MNKYKHLFFDLDRTLWDFDTNNTETFRELYTHFQLEALGVEEVTAFYKKYQKINLALWDAYKKAEITKKELNFQRFYQSLLLYTIDNAELATRMGAYYVKESPLKTHLYPHTLETLEKLHRKYQMHIITNGFDEVQYIKMENSGLMRFFDKIITSEAAGYKKPDKRIFEYALQQAGATVQESIIIGDDPEADIYGACLVGMDQIWVKHLPLKPELTRATYSVNELKEITAIL